MDSAFTDPEYLKREQYRDAGNLDRRIALHERFSTNPQGWHNWAYAQFEFPPGSPILEVGAGPGPLWARNQGSTPRDWRVTLSDLSEGMIADARRRLLEFGCFSYVACDVQDLPFPSGTFDGLIANHMLYHVPDLDRALAAVARVLAPGGKLYATTNGETHLHELAAYVRRVRSGASTRAANDFPRRLHNFSLQSGPAKLRGWFEEIEIRRYPDSLRVTDPEAIVRFVESSSFFRLHPEGMQRLRALLSDEVDRNGAVEITKEPGMLIAVKRKDT